MQRNFRVGDRVKLINVVKSELGLLGNIIEQIPEDELFRGEFRVSFDTGGQGICTPKQMELLSGNKEINLSEVAEKVDNALWFEKTIASDEAFKSKPGYALAAVVKVLLAKGVLTPSDFDLLKTEESALTTVPANKD